MKKFQSPAAVRFLGIAEFWSAVVLTLVSLSFHFRWMNHAGALWRDEVGSVEFATMPSLGDIWRNLAYDNFPPFHLVPLRLWHALGMAGDYEGWRWFGLAVGVIFLGVLWLWACRGQFRAPLLVLAMAGLNPLAIRTIDSIRPYGMGIILMVLLFASAWRAARESSRLNLFWTGMWSVLAVQCLYQNSVFVFALVAAASGVMWMRREPKSIGGLVLAGVVAALSLIPHGGHLKTGRDWGVVAQSPVGLDYLVNVCLKAMGEAGGWSCLIILPGLFAALVWGVSRISGAHSARLAAPEGFASTALLLGTAGYFSLLLLSKLPSQAWYYVILIVFWGLVLDMVCSGNLIARWARLAAVSLLVITGWPNLWNGTSVRQTNMDDAVARISIQGRPGDLVLIYPWQCGLTWKHLYRGSLDWETVPALEDVRIHRYDLLKEMMSRPDQSGVTQATREKIQSTLQMGNRVWLVGGLPTFPAGQQTPELPPAPSSPYKWSSAAYEYVWAGGIGSFIQAHATGAEVIYGPLKSGINPFENLPLIVVQGWKE